jgi:hypothetical protein
LKVGAVPLSKRRVSIFVIWQLKHMSRVLLKEKVIQRVLCWLTVFLLSVQILFLFFAVSFVGSNVVDPIYVRLESSVGGL